MFLFSKDRIKEVKYEQVSTQLSNTLYNLIYFVNPKNRIDEKFVQILNNVAERLTTLGYNNRMITFYYYDTMSNSVDKLFKKFASPQRNDLLFIAKKTAMQLYNTNE